MSKPEPEETYPFSQIKFVNYLNNARTMNQIARKFKISESEALRLLKKPIKNYDLFEPRNKYHELTYCYVRRPPEELVLEKRIIATRYAEGKEDYLIIQIRDKTDELRIIPLCDAHYGNRCHRPDKFLRYIEYIRETDGVYAVLMGDMMEAKTETGKGHIYDQIVDPNAQLNDMTLMLSPIAHKILAMCPGNHERQIKQKSGIDICDVMAQRLKIPYFSGVGAFHILWKGHEFGFNIFHGKGSSQSIGGRVNAAISAKKWWEGIDFFLSGHTHKSVCMHDTKFVPDTMNARLIDRTYWILVAPSFMSYWGSYAQDSNYDPPSKGGVACVLYSDGGYKAEYTAGY